ncbi:MAG: hypothetical protein JKX72_01250 [Robiginitomaculum sp.]|nr:hypothetical protein [Robiginitomaculum sp.]
MTLESIYYMTQIVAVGLILVSLVAIYLQQRKDHALARAETVKDLTKSGMGYFNALVNEPRTLDSVRVCLQDYVSATPREQMDFIKFTQYAVLIAEQAYFMEQEKLLPGSGLQRHIAFPLAILNTPGGRQIWQLGKNSFSDEIRILLDKQLSENGHNIPPVWEIIPALGADLVNTDPQPIAKN